MDAEAMTKAPADADTGAPPPRGGWLRRYAPLLVLVALMAGVFASGLHEHLTLNALARNRAALDGYVRDHLALSVLVFALAYVAAVVLSLPGATILTMAGGLLFGWFWGGTISVLAATAGAVGVFLVARSALGGALTARAGRGSTGSPRAFARTRSTTSCSCALRRYSRSGWLTWRPRCWA